MTKNDVYTLNVGEADKKRLQILNKIYNPSTQQFLLDSGLKKNMRVLEIGCGTGEMSCWVAKQIGPNGQMVAVDQSEQQIEITKQLALSQGISNLECRALDIKHLDTLEGEFDLIFCRWVIIFLKDPHAGLRMMYNKLKTGGILACEDGTVDGLFCYPDSEVFNQWVNYWKSSCVAHGIDFNLGRKLYDFFLDLHCDHIKVRFFQPAYIKEEEKLTISMAVQSGRQINIDDNVITAEAIDQLIAGLQELASKKGIIGFIRNTLISGQKIA